MPLSFPSLEGGMFASLALVLKHLDHRSSLVKYNNVFVSLETGFF